MSYDNQPTHFSLLLSQDVGFLWKSSGRDSRDSLPILTFPMENVVARFSNRKAGERLYKAEFEILTLRWLSSLTLNTQNIKEEPESTLTPTGFIEAIKGADVLLEAEL